MDGALVVWSRGESAGFCVSVAETPAPPLLEVLMLFPGWC